MNKVNIDTVLLTYGGYLQKLHDFCSALVVRHQKSQAKFCWNFKFHWAPVQPLVFSLFWWSPFHIWVTLIPVQRSQQNWKVRQLASDGRWWGERDGGINVGYKPLITSWETPQCPPSPLPSFLSDTLNCSNIVSWETKYDRDKVPQKSGSREQTLLFVLSLE